MRGLVMIFWMCIFGYITFRLSPSNISVIGRFSGGLAVWVISVLEVHHLTRRKRIRQANLWVNCDWTESSVTWFPRRILTNYSKIWDSIHGIWAEEFKACWAMTLSVPHLCGGLGSKICFRTIRVEPVLDCWHGICIIIKYASLEAKHTGGRSDWSRGL